FVKFVSKKTLPLNKQNDPKELFQNTQMQYPSAALVDRAGAFADDDAAFRRKILFDHIAENIAERGDQLTFFHHVCYGGMHIQYSALVGVYPIRSLADHGRLFGLFDLAFGHIEVLQNIVDASQS